ncbi:hypothetical protein SAMN05421874_13812 [Nonomuraea maritima]|uniref:Uncharacterized protein n=1 Tax=Nonomuraea maritima TaxID=683260 RepID=A0A1G9QBQ4_9ACTN|nr:hypothetical protein [Nonomuraea maritima]SDM08373.1 hypothetical protein SAMN05421874_13812 [Nonomuraea maritima]
MNIEAEIRELKLRMAALEVDVPHGARTTRRRARSRRRHVIPAHNCTRHENDRDALHREVNDGFTALNVEIVGIRRQESDHFACATSAAWAHYESLHRALTDLTHLVERLMKHLDA